MERIRTEKKLVEARLRKNKLAASKYDAQMGPLMKVYGDDVAHIGALYEAAKAKHAKGVDLLVKEFNYHPSFSKGKPNEFWGRPFKPK